MHHDKDDSKGYYSVLGLTSIVSAAQIKKAYRRRAMELHPDRNPDNNTTQQFQFLNEAYAVLSDPVSRAEYDTQSIAAELATPKVPDPIVCSVCAKVSAQPRVVVFRSVKSFLFLTIRKPIAGVYCSSCAQKQSLKASATSWLLGWWGFPWGPLYTVQALVINMFGGSHPPLENAKMLGYQAYYFYTIGRPDLARSIAQNAMRYCKKIPKTLGRNAEGINERDSLTTNLEAFIDELGGDKDNRLKSSWGLIHGRFFIHFGVVAAMTVAIIITVINTSAMHYSLARSPMPYSAQAVPPAAAANSSGTHPAQRPLSATNQRELAAKIPTYVRPKTAPNGKPWPRTASYLIGEPQTHKTGHSEVTIDNGQNNSDVFLKLVALQGMVAKPARQILIPARSRFTIKNLTPGDYDVRYRDLTSGGLSRSEVMTLTETPTSRGTQYSVVTLTLYKVANGNTATYGLSEDEF
ncbi:J domain-containing protein [Pseudomonas sp. O39]|uniref:J domain-containing protein n=1 Tax=Pseudomonas sp. O39 TaxID=3379130 RepID=UPI00387B4240